MPLVNSSFSGGNSYTRALETDDAQNFGDEAIDFIKYGITGALTSGVVGIVNTGVAFTNMFGSDFQKFDTFDTLQSLGLDHTADYYADHKAALDTVGFVASSIIPGMIGLKAAKAAQGLAAAANPTSKVALAVRAALVSDTKARRMHRAIKDGLLAVPDRTKFMQRAAAEGFHQAAVESFFAETAILLTTNQSPAITNEDLTYMEAIRDNLGGAAFGLALGTGAGGIINAAIGYNTMMKIGGKKLLEQNNLIGDVGVDSKYIRTAINPGDKAALLLNQRKHVLDQMESLRTGGAAADTGTVDFMQKSLNDIDSQVQDTLMEMVTNFDKSGMDAGELAGTLWSKLKDMDNIDAIDFVANLNKITRFDDADALFDPAITKMDVIADEDWIDAVAQKVFKDSYDPTSQTQKDAVRSSAQSANGLYIRNDAGRADIHILESLTKRGDEKAIRAVIFHEMGHANTDRLARTINMNPLGIKDQMVALSKMHRPAHWQQLEMLPKARAAQERMLRNPNTSLDDLTTLSDYIKLLEQKEAYLMKPEELLADSWAVLNTKAVFHEASKKAPDLYSVLANNAAVKQRVGWNEALVDIRSGNMFAVPDRAPTVGDIGNVNYDLKLKQVTFGQGSSRGKVDIKKDFNVLTATPTEASAHYYAAAKDITPLRKELTVEWTDFATLNKILARHKNGKYEGTVTVNLGSGETSVVTLTKEDGKAFRELYGNLKVRAVKEMRNGDRNITPSHLARILDVDEEFAYASGLTGGTKFWSDLYPVDKPSVVKVAYKTRTDVSDPLNMESLADVQMRYRENRNLIKRAVVSFLKKIDDSVTDILPPNAMEAGQNIARTATQLTDGAGFLRTFQGEYASIESFAQAVAEGNSKAKAVWHRMINDRLSADAMRVAANKNALYEASVLDSVLRRDKFTFAPAASNTLEFQSYLQGLIRDQSELGIRNAMRNIEQLKQRGIIDTILKDKTSGTIWGDTLVDALTTVVNTKRLTDQQMTALANAIEKGRHTIKSPELVNLWKTKVDLNKVIVEGKRTVASVRGLDTNLRDDVLYPGQFNTKLYKHIKFVYPKKGSTIFSDSKPSVIASSTPEGLAQKEQMIREAFGDDVIIRTRDEIERNFKLKGEFDSQLALSDYHVDSALLNKGILSDAIPEPDEELMRHYVRHMNLEASSIIDNLTAANYSEEFALLEHYGNIQRANMSSLGGASTVKKPAPTLDEKLINIMLNHESGTFEGWKTAQQGADRAVSKMFNNVRGMFGSANNTVEYERLNSIMDDYNLPRPFDNRVGEYLRTTEKVPEATLKEVMPRVNALASTFMLRLDAIQWMVNAFSLPITAVPELKHLVDSLPALRKQQVLHSLSSVVPDTVDAAGQAVRMPSNAKVMMQAVKDFFTDKQLVEKYDRLGLMPSIVREIREGIDDVALDPKMLNKAGEVSKWKQRFEKVKEVALAPSDFSEAFVKFVAARTADLVLTAGGIADEAVKHAAMLTYVKRVHGNYAYAQRPAMFQGFAGQAIGLFQTYQFNLFQQFLRHVGDKRISAASSMLGLQAGIFGIQGVPGFQLLNNYIGERSAEGNDFYTGTVDVFGNDVAEWMLYGVSSNFTKPITGQGIEMYTRGDLTPRTPILIPTSVADVPAVSLTTKFVSNIYNSVGNLLTVGNNAEDASQLAAGAGQVFLEALAQNGVNRPLAGLGQVLSGAKTTSQGSVLAVTQDLDWWSTATRLMGSRDLNEAVAVQAFYRAKGYDSARREKINSLGQSAKRMIRSGEWSDSTYSSFLQNYVEQGGRQEYFERWLHEQAMGATESTIMDMYKVHDSPSGRYMQKLLGGNIENYIDVTYDTQ